MVLRYRSRWTGHKHFSKKLKDSCPKCHLHAGAGPAIDTPEHSLFVCPDHQLHSARGVLILALKNDAAVQNADFESWETRAYLARSALIAVSPVGIAFRELMLLTDQLRGFVM